MCLHIHSDASYLTASKGRSRYGGHFFLGNTPDKHHPQLHNGAILAAVGILKNVMASAAESEIGGIYEITKLGVPIRVTLDEMGHPQPEKGTPVETDNTTAEGILNETVQQKRSRAMDMRFYWVQDRIRQNQYHLIWAPGKTKVW